MDNQQSSKVLKPAFIIQNCAKKNYNHLKKKAAFPRYKPIAWSLPAHGREDSTGSKLNVDLQHFTFIYLFGQISDGPDIKHLI